MVDQAQIFENMQATAFGEAILEAQLKIARDTICNFLEVETSRANPDDPSVIDEMTFEQAYSMLIKEGYLINTYVKEINGKMIFHAEIFERIRCTKEEIRT